MKKIITMVTLLVGLTGFAQKEVAKKINELLVQNVTFKPYSVLTKTTDVTDRQIQTVVGKATLATIKTQSVTELVTQQPDYIEVAIPYLQSTIQVQLYKVKLFAEGFHVDTDQSTSIAYEKGVHYRGIVKNDPNSVASFNFFKGELNGMISSEALNNLVIGKLDKANNTSDYIIYSDADMKVRNDSECHVKDVVSAQPDTNRNPATAQPESTRCVTVYFEIDRNLYLANGSNTTTTTNWMTSVFNNVQTLYNNDGITISLKSLYIWTLDDPYEGNSSSDYLFQFNEIRPVFDGDVGQLVGIDPGGLGGVAVTIDGLCSQDNFSYSDVNFSYSTVPTYSWTVMVVTHEFGHLLGSPHTHACVWNGNATPIDNCAPYSLGESGEGFNCMSDPPILPSETVKGTIMSYCHLVSGIGINFANGFGPQPAARILSAVNSGQCLSTDCINTCINRVTNIEVTATETTATITWEELGSVTNWQVAVTSFVGGGTPVWVDVTTNSYTVSNLQPNRYYRFRVRPICGSNLVAPFEQSVFATATNFCNGVQITDTGGVSGNYTNTESYIRTIIPNVADKKIVLTFTAFNLEEDYDYLYVYNGNSTAAPSFNAEGYTGTNIPGPFESTAPDGSLTVRFFADGGVVESGYVANIVCEDYLANETFGSNIDFTYFPNPTNGLVSINSKTQITEILVYNIEGRLLYKSKANELNAKVDISDFATGTYFFKLKFNDKEANFKILKSN